MNVSSLDRNPGGNSSPESSGVSLLDDVMSGFKPNFYMILNDFAILAGLLQMPWPS